MESGCRGCRMPTRRGRPPPRGQSAGQRPWEGRQITTVSGVFFFTRTAMNREVSMEAPQYPAGAFVPEDDHGPARRDELIAVIAGAPAALRRVVAGLSEEQLDTRYRNWTVRQIVNHLADSHVNCYVRFKWALTEDRPTIKPYDEGRWAALADSRSDRK